jgi:peptidyl-prolyl cis-trans isomerase B (cyclophilin B)
MPAVAGLVISGLLASGCGGKASQEATENPPAKPPSEAKTVPVPTPAAHPVAGAKLDPALHQPFDDATIPDAPDGQELPAETMNGKSVGKLYTQVVKLWDKIAFESAPGKPMAYRAVLETHLGNVAITLRPDLAPNHVRNFVALAKVGYYNGLVFERTVHEESDAQAGVTLDYVEAGCPLGTGDPRYGSIGYWMRPEFQDKVRHEEGTVGAWHVEEADTAACKFYITLSKAPELDGNFTVFGKVTGGLDVVRRIAQRPVHNDPELRDRPENPVVIRKVTIETREAGH